MLHLPNNKYKLAALAVMAILTGAMFMGGEANATSCDDGIAPCVEVSFGTTQGGNLSVQPGISYCDSTQFYLPVEIGLKNTSAYTIKVYGDGSSLTSGSDSIPTIGTDTTYSDLGKNGSEWGVRWNLGDVVEDKDTNYHKIPASVDDADAIVAENQSLPKSSTTVKKQLTLGFAVAVDANQPSGSYTNTITVAVVASPRDARSFFDIANMQDMTAEICQNTTTPAKTATTKFDTDGSHPEDTSYVPQTTLTDTRNGRQYLVRKLADGNCWMSQNLSLHLSTSVPLTSNDTDLNSKTSWTPQNNTESKGTVWGEDGKDRSYSAGWTQYWAGGTSFTDSGNAAYGSTAGYAQRGMYYNWFAATAGSGKLTDINTTTEGNRIINGVVQDSICPKGWTLPDGGTTAVGSTDGSVKSFYNLVQTYTGITGSITNATVNTLYASPMNFVPAGFYNFNSSSTGLQNVGERQLYWTNTAGAAARRAWNMQFGSSNTTVYTTTTSEGSHGMSVRCIAR